MNDQLEPMPRICEHCGNEEVEEGYPFCSGCLWAWDAVDYWLKDENGKAPDPPKDRRPW